MILTVDIGNSRIKWASWQEDKITARGVVAYDEKKLSKNFDELFSSVALSPEVSPLKATPLKATPLKERPSRVFVVCVAGNNVIKALNEWLQQRWQLDAEYLKTEKQFDNIINAYDDPAQHGVDRWASVVAGHQRYQGASLCVISAGTAITIDLINK
ncbi:MAG: type III pantothenate kinase, partial [Gammaproteobacteria bacterium]|nr:type III pantothenate kinase [Gammaproteobacteria bacterium]